MVDKVVVFLPPSWHLVGYEPVYAIFNVYLSIQILDQYAVHDSVAIEFLKSLSERHKEVIEKIQKH